MIEVLITKSLGSTSQQNEIPWSPKIAEEIQLGLDAIAVYKKKESFFFKTFFPRLSSIFSVFLTRIQKEN